MRHALRVELIAGRRNFIHFFTSMRSSLVNSAAVRQMSSPSLLTTMAVPVCTATCRARAIPAEGKVKKNKLM